MALWKLIHFSNRTAALWWVCVWECYLLCVLCVYVGVCYCVPYVLLIYNYFISVNKVLLCGTETSFLFNVSQSESITNGIIDLLPYKVL